MATTIALGYGNPSSSTEGCCAYTTSKEHHCPLSRHQEGKEEGQGACSHPPEVAYRYPALIEHV